MTQPMHFYTLSIENLSLNDVDTCVVYSATFSFKQLPSDEQLRCRIGKYLQNHMDDDELKEMLEEIWSSYMMSSEMSYKEMREKFHCTPEKFYDYVISESEDIDYKIRIQKNKIVTEEDD